MSFDCPASSSELHHIFVQHQQYQQYQSQNQFQAPQGYSMNSALHGGGGYQTNASSGVHSNHNHHNNHFDPSSMGQEHMPDDFYDRVLSQVPDEQIVAGLQLQSQAAALSARAASEPKSRPLRVSGQEEEEEDDDAITLANLLEDDPLESFTTIDRQVSNDTILQPSSPISPGDVDGYENPIRPPKLEQHDQLTLNNNASQTSLVNNHTGTPQSQVQSMTPNVFPTPANSTTGFSSMNQSPPTSQNYTISHHHQHHHHQPQQVMDIKHEAIQEGVIQPSSNMNRNVMVPSAHHTGPNQVPNHLHMQIKNQTMFQQQNQLQQQQQQQQHQHVQAQTFHAQQAQAQAQMQNHIQMMKQQQHVLHFNQHTTPGNHQIQQQQLHHQMYMNHQHMAQQYQPQMQMNGPMAPLQPQQIQVQVQQSINHQQHQHPQQQQLNDSSSFKKVPMALPPTPPNSQPPMTKSSSTTKINKIKKNSSFATVNKTCPNNLKKSKSFLTANSASSKSKAQNSSSSQQSSMYSTLDFSKHIQKPSAKDLYRMRSGSTSQTPIKVNVIKNFEFVFEHGDGKFSTPRKSSTNSTPTSAKFPNFAKPPMIDASNSSFYSPKSSPTNSEASGNSPLTMGAFQSNGGNFIQQSPIPSSVNRFSPNSGIPSPVTSEGFSLKTRKRSIISNSDRSDNSPPPTVLKDMKSGLIEFKVKAKK